MKKRGPKKRSWVNPHPNHVVLVKKFSRGDIHPDTKMIFWRYQNREDGSYYANWVTNSQFEKNKKNKIASKKRSTKKNKILLKEKQKKEMVECLYPD